MRLCFIALMLFCGAVAYAQAPQGSAADRVATQIGQMVIQLEGQKDQIAALQKEVATLTQQKKECENKPEVKK